jgi:hypothetical protein
VRIHAGIFQHLGWERSQSPVCRLVALVGDDIAVHFQKLSETMPREVEHLGGMEGVEEIDEIQVEVALQPNDIRFRTMQYLQDRM